MNAVPKEIMDLLHKLIKERDELAQEIKRIRSLLEELQKESNEKL